MAKGFTIRNEEYTPLADIIREKFGRDFDKINPRYPKLNLDFKNNFEAKIEVVKTQEKKLVITNKQKGITDSLYHEADDLEEELSFVVDYFADAGLDNTIVKLTIKNLRSHNIEGATDNIETMRQVIVANQSSLVEQGMQPEFPSKLADHKISLEKKNKDQKMLMDSGEIVTDKNNINYDDLYKDIKNISQKAQKVLKNTPYAKEYVISSIIGSMRAAKRKPKEDNNQ